MSNRYLEYIGIDPEPTNLIPFSCIYLFKGEKHKIVIYANNWAEAHSYANHHGLVVEEKLSFGVENKQ